MIVKNLKIIGRVFLTNRVLFLMLLFTKMSFCQTQKKVDILSQYPKIKLVGKDTIMMFTIEQSKVLAKYNEERLKLQKSLSITKYQMAFKDSIIKMQESEIVNYKMINIEHGFIVQEMNKKNKICLDEKIILNAEIKKQRRHKNISISAGILSFATMLYFYIHK